MTDKLKQAIEVLKRHKDRDDFGSMVYEAIDTVVAEVETKTYTAEEREKYGKYCAVQAWKEAIQQHSMLSLSNMVNGGFVMKSPDEWWSEFQRKEATECPIKTDSCR